MNPGKLFWRTPTVAMLWEIWARNRVSYLWHSAALGAGLCFVQLKQGGVSEIPAALLALASLAGFAFGYLQLLSCFAYVEMDAAGVKAGYPSRLLLKPLRTFHLIMVTTHDQWRICHRETGDGSGIKCLDPFAQRGRSLSLPGNRGQRDLVFRSRFAHASGADFLADGVPARRLVAADHALKTLHFAILHPTFHRGTGTARILRRPVLANAREACCRCVEYGCRR